MTDIIDKLEILPSKNQLILYEYENYFNFFANLNKKNKLPHTILLSGLKGSGKSTFAYHLINYLLSCNDTNKYSIIDKTIHPENKNYVELCNNISPNFLLLENDSLEEDIKIEKIRNALKFLSKSTYSSNIKIVLIDNVEYLNEHSSNALLKVLEESNNRTYFFIIHDASCKILNTIKSRCFEFRIFFSINEKKRILENLNMQYGNFFNSNDFNEILQFDSPGNILKYFFLLKNSGINFSRNKLEAIIYLIENYKNKNFVEISNFISFLIELYYNDLSLRNLEKLNYYSHNRFKLLKLINNTKFFNLDKKNLFTSIIGTLENESK